MKVRVIKRVVMMRPAVSWRALMIKVVGGYILDSSMIRIPRGER